MRKVLAVFLAGFFIASFLFALPLVNAEEQVDAKALFEKKCSVCHEIERPKSMRQTRAQWEVTMNWMKSMSDANISEEEAKIILDYLVENYGKK